MAKAKKFRVCDFRTDETLFEGTNIDCLKYIVENFPIESEDFKYVWLEKIE